MRISACMRVRVWRIWEDLGFLFRGESRLKILPDPIFIYPDFIASRPIDDPKISRSSAINPCTQVCLSSSCMCTMH